MNNKTDKDLINPWNIKISFLVILIGAFITTSILAEFKIVTSFFDMQIAQFFGNHQSKVTDLIFIVITTTADTINLMIAGFILTIIKRTRKFGMILLITLVAITILVTYIKPLLGIEHTGQTFVPLITLPDKFTLERDSFMPFAMDYSYPSNHIASATAFGFIIGGLAFKYSKRFSLIFLIAFPAIIGLSKLYLMQHNLFDLVGGYLLGLIVTGFIVMGLKANTKIENSQINDRPKEKDEVN
jgi:membrane-associated phospholipid phosphatase